MMNGLRKDKSRTGLAGRPALPVLLARRVFTALLLAGLAVPAAAQVVSIAGGGGVTEGGTATFTFTASPVPSAPIAVNVDVTDIGRFAGAGQTGSRTVTVGAGGTAVLEVTTVDDRTDEPKGAITVAVKPGHGYVLGSPSSAAVTVVDNDLPPPFVVSIAGGSSVTEGGTARFTLTMSPAPPAAMAVTVDVTDSGSFAVDGQTGARDVTIATDGTGSLQVTTVNDGTDEPNGVIGAGVRAGSDDYRAGPPVSAAVSVLDDDVAPPASKPVVWFGEMPKTVQEGGFINLNVKVHPQLKSPMTIYFRHGGTATVGSDYDIGNRGSGRLAVEMHANAPGVNYAMPIAEDVVEEGDETAVITLVADEAYKVGTPGVYVLTIEDSEDSVVPQVSLSTRSSCSCTEGDAVRFTLAAEPAPSAPLAVTLTVGQNGDHVGPSALGRRTVTVPTSGSVTVTVPTMDDGADEPDGTVTATLEAGSGYTLGASSSLAVDVADNDSLPRLSFAERRVDVAESDNPGATTDAVLTVQLSAKSDKPVTFEYALSGKATAGEDYEAPQSTSVTIAPGSTSADLVFKVKDDPRHETLETIFVTLTDPVNALAPAPGNLAVVLISSDDGPPVLSVETSSVVEPPPGYGRYMPFALTLTPASGLDVFVDVADTMTGTASNVHTCYGYCEDYVTGRSRVQFAPGETYKVVHLGVLSDARDEEDETIVVRLSAASKQVTFAEGTLSGTRWVLEVAGTIEDDDTRGIEVTPASLALAALDGAGSYEVSLTSQPTHIVALELSSGDPAVATVSPARLTFNPVNWDKPRTVTVTAVDDGNADGARTATVSHTVVAGTSDYGAVTVPDVTVTVSGGDPPPALTSEPAAEPVTVSLSAEASSIAEAYGKTKFRIELSRVLVAGEMVKVPFTIDGGKWKRDWHVKFQDAHNGPGVERTQSGRKSAVRFTEGGRAATLVLVARPNEDTEARTISIAFGTGKRAPRATGVAGGIVLAGDPIAVAILDDDLVALSVDDAKAKESKRWMRFTVRLSAKAEKPVTASFSTRSSSPVSAREGADYRKLDTRVRFEPGETEKEVKVRIFDDSHNEGPETFEVFLSRSSTGAGIADGVAVGTITNDDPLPGAWLARFGRAVAERALDGITARLAADRTPGLQGSIAGQSLDFAPAASDGADLAPGSGAGPGSLSGAGGAGFGQEAQSQARGMTMQEVLRGSSFSLTGEADSSGGTLAFWGGTPGSGGLVSGSRFSGDQRGDGTAVGLHGETATALLGTDYARGRWFVGFALSETRAEGGYAPIDGDAEASGGDVEASLTATIPYAALAVSDRLRLWGAAGQGAGDVTVKTGTESLRADTAWSMAAAGIRGDLLAPAAGSADGPSLALVSDALWVRTSSEKVSGLAASESDVSRLRLGLEGSWGLSLSDGGAVTPRLEFGARHDGGDAETGFGVELGGGLAWHDPKLGLRLDLSGRTLVAHDDGALEDRGVSAQLAYDPAPASGRGLSLSLGQDWGGRAQGGLDALFAPEPLEHRAPGSGSGAGGGEAISRWSMEAAWGLPVLGNRFTGSPWMGLGLAAGARDYSLGWRLTPEAATAPDVSFGLKATRRESDTADPEHSVGIEVGARW